MRPIILLGATGYVGQAFESELSRRGIPARTVSRTEVDYYRPGALTRLLEEERPSFLINAAGYTGKPNVDACELDRAGCLLGNAVLPGIVSDACGSTGTIWGHVSSGCIYTGKKPGGSGFTEEDAPNFSFRSPPCSFYSGSKALGEEVLENAPQCYIWRLRIPFDNIDSPRNYLSKMLRYPRLLEAENSISHRGEFVAACVECLLRGVPFGTYNVTNPGVVTTREVVGRIRAILNPPQEFHYFRDEGEFMALAAKTPRSNCLLDPSKLLATGIPMTPVHEALDRSLRDWRKEV